MKTNDKIKLWIVACATLGLVAAMATTVEAEDIAVLKPVPENIAWGEAVNGLKMGASLDKTEYVLPERMRATLWLKNESDKPINFIPYTEDNGWVVLNESGEEIWRSHYKGGGRNYQRRVEIIYPGKIHQSVSVVLNSGCVMKWVLTGRYRLRFNYNRGANVLNLNARECKVEYDRDLLKEGWMGEVRTGDFRFNTKLGSDPHIQVLVDTPKLRTIRDGADRVRHYVDFPVSIKNTSNHSVWLYGYGLASPIYTLYTRLNNSTDWAKCTRRGYCGNGLDLSELKAGEGASFTATYSEDEYLYFNELEFFNEFELKEPFRVGLTFYTSPKRDDSNSIEVFSEEVFIPSDKKPEEHVD